MLTVLGGLAEFERELILARTGDGRTRAKARGVRFGRPPALTAHQWQEAMQRLSEGTTQADLARTYGVSQATISRLQPSPFEGYVVPVCAGENRKHANELQKWSQRCVPLVSWSSIDDLAQQRGRSAVAVSPL
jgi:hypothetical protein